MTEEEIVVILMNPVRTLVLLVDESFKFPDTTGDTPILFYHKNDSTISGLADNSLGYFKRVVEKIGKD